MRETKILRPPAFLAALTLLGLPCAGATPVDAQTAGPGTPALPVLFETADRCIGCHKGVTTASGRDVSIGYDWRASMMANAARDPYWQAAVRREVTDHPAAREAIEDKCSTCHMPMARAVAHLGGSAGDVFAHLPLREGGGPHPALAADGASCTVCHQILDEKLGTAESFTGGFVVDATTPLGEREILGPFEVDAGRAHLMQSAVGYRPAKAEHMRSSEVCATCHTLYTHAFDDDGREAGELPEQVPYLEWKHSAYPSEARGCTTCHMPVVEEEVPVTGVLGVPRSEVSRHVFRGGNFFVLGMLGRHRSELGVQALGQELDAAVERTLDHLGSSAATVTLDALRVVEGRLEADVTVANLGGHKLPTAYPSRRVWIHLSVKDATGRTVFESGAPRPDGAIQGNDNDLDPARFEPHHVRIDQPDDVQIYETIMTDAAGRVTTGLLRGVRYEKDNRLTPKGFDKAAAPDDVAVHGEALGDEDFLGGGDRVRYVTDLRGARGPFTVEVELLYQPVAFRWARNLEAYDSPETARFVAWYDQAASTSYTLLARDTDTVAAR
jgi:hypothetical protein